nr:exodeoxyribonuclease VII large subunit [Chloroflexota bacterium]
ALDTAATDLPRHSAMRVASARSSLDASAAALAVLGPGATLDRGYAIVRREPDGSIVRDPSDASPGTGLRIRVAHGDIAATVDDEPVR